MEATVRATCPQCKTTLRIPAQWVGQAVKCKKCGAMVRSKAKAEDDTPPNGTSLPNGTAPATPAPAQEPAPQPNAFDFSQPSDEDDNFFGLPEPAPAPAPVAGPPLDANGYPMPQGAPAPYPYPAPPGAPPAAGYPLPPGYPYGPPPGYPYPMPPGYGPPPGYPLPPGYPVPPGAPGATGAPAAPYPYPAPGYPPPAQHGYAPPPGYPVAPGYGYPQPAAPAPAQPAAQPAAPAAAQPAAPVQPNRPAAANPAAPAKPGAVAPTKPGAASPNAKGQPAPAAPARGQPAPAKGAPAPAPVPPSNEFKMDPAGSAATASHSAKGGKYRRGNSKGKYVWIGVCLLLTAGLVAAGVYGGKVLNEKYGNKPKQDDSKGDANHAPTPPPAGPSTNAAFPRRVLFISITKYMYLNPLTQAQPGAPDKTKPAASALAFNWRVPIDKDNNQVFVLSDTLMGPDERLPMKNVVEGTYREFFRTSRKQDRILMYFGGHAIEKGGKAYIAPMEAETDGEDWEKSVIPLEQFYSEMQKCAATQKVIVWDVCRFNPEKGKVRPGSEPMSEPLYKALTSPPPGVQAIVTCKPGENALEFSALRPDGFNGPVYSGSVFLESMKFVGEPRNNRLPKSNPAATDPLPVVEWSAAISKRATEMAELAEKAGNMGKQTVTIAGTAPATLVAPDPGEKVASRFEFPHPPKGASQMEIQAVAREFHLPPMKPGLSDMGLGEFPFPADVMKDYMSDGVGFDVILKEKEKYPLRVAVIEAMNKLRDTWASGAGRTKIRTELVGPIDDKLKNEVKKENDDWAIGIIELDLQLGKLKDVAEMRASEPKRWQAHYDFALAATKARLAYMNEYNKILGNIVTETLPPLDPKQGQDGYILVASETLKSGKDIKKMAEEAHEAFQEITVKYKGTPWAIQAKQEKSVQIGLAWKPASLKKE